MRRAHRFLAIAWMMLAPAARGAEIVVQANDSHGRPAVDAVVTLAPQAEAAAVAARAGATTKFIDQRDETFIPYVEVFRPGDTVIFRNSDHTRHHAYSFSATKSFEFVLGPGESSNPLVLERA